MLYVFLGMLLLITAQWLGEVDDKAAKTILQAKRLISAPFFKKRSHEDHSSNVFLAAKKRCFLFVVQKEETSTA